VCVCVCARARVCVRVCARTAAFHICILIKLIYSRKKALFQLLFLQILHL